jgi:ferredoxin
MAYMIRIDENACSAHGDCADIAPEVFRVDEVAVVIATGHDELALAAAEVCPTTAIILTDEATGRQVYP